MTFKIGDIVRPKVGAKYTHTIRGFCDLLKVIEEVGHTEILVQVLENANSKNYMGGGFIGQKWYVRSNDFELAGPEMKAWVQYGRVAK